MRFIAYIGAGIAMLVAVVAAFAALCGMAFLFGVLLGAVRFGFYLFSGQG